MARKLNIDASDMELYQSIMFLGLDSLDVSIILGDLYECVVVEADPTILDMETFRFRQRSFYRV